MKTKTTEMMTQVSLRQGNSVMTTWVDDHPHLKVGNLLELKSVGGTWIIEKVWASMPRKTVESNYGWDNNNYDKHTGLGI